MGREWFSRVFHPLRPISSSKAIKVIAFDTEDNSTGVGSNFICACFYSDDEQRVFWDRAEARNYIFVHHKYPPIMAAHNLRYDLDNLDFPEFTASRIESGSRLIGATYEYNKGNTIKFMDTGNFFVGDTINSLGKQLGFPKIGCDCEDPSMDDRGICSICGFYSYKFHRNKSASQLSPEAKDAVSKYCMRDSEICYHTIRKLADMTLQNNTRFKAFTAASLAMRIYRTNFMRTPMVKRAMEVNDIERLAYYGGRTEVFDYNLHKSVHAEDIKSSYPRAMKEEIFPNPSTYSVKRMDIEEALKYEGISIVTVSVPDMHIPPLPYRRADGKLVFPTGTWTAAYTHPEIRMAMKHGVEIKACHKSIVYPNTFRPFTDFINTFYHMKETTKGIDSKFYKLVMNCFSEDTTILTMNGHKNIKDIQEGEMVYSFNPSTLETEFKPVTKTFSYCYFGNMVHITSGKKIDMLVTPNHRMFLAADHSEDFKFITADKISNHRFPKLSPIKGSMEENISLEKYIRQDEKIIIRDGQRLWRPPHAKHKGNGVPLSFKTCDMLELAGWYVSEGHVVQNGIAITQSSAANPEKCKLIEDLLIRLGVRYQVKTSKSGENYYMIYHRLIQQFMIEHFGRYAEGVFISNDIFKYDSSLLERLYISMMRGDGCLTIQSKMSSQSFKYTTKSNKLAKSFQRLCIHLGLLSRIYYEHCNDKRCPSFIYRIFIYRVGNFMLRKSRNQAVIKQNNSPMVYCIEVADNHTVISGREGTMHVTGQSLSGKWGEKRYEKLRFRMDDTTALERICRCAHSSLVPGTNHCSNCNKPSLVNCAADAKDGYITMTGNRMKDPSNAFPILISYITAYGRIKLFEDRLRCGNESKSMIYTDSVTGNRCTTIRYKGMIDVVPFEQLFDMVESETTTEHGKDIKYPYDLEALTIKNNKPTFKHVNKIIRHMTDKQTVIIAQKFGCSETTLDHSYMSSKGKTTPIEMLEHDMISLHDIPQNKVIPNYENLESEIILCLAYISDGSVSDKESSCRNMLSIAKDDKEYLEMLSTHFNKIFGFKPSIIPACTSKRTGKITYALRNARNEVCQWFKSRCGQGAFNKRMPSFIFNIDLSKWMPLIVDMLKKGDGSNITSSTGTYSEQHQKEHLVFCSGSLRLISGIDLLLKMTGKVSTIVYREYKPGKAVYTITSSNNWNNHNRSDIITPPHKPQYVYDLEIEDTHTFVDACGQILLHNTDSSMSEDEFDINMGDQLGNWDRCTYEDFKAYAPKFYDYSWKVMPNGERRPGDLKLKGVPKHHKIVYECPCSCFITKEEFDQDPACRVCGFPLTKDHELREFERPLKTNEAQRRHLPPNLWLPIRKRISFLDNKRTKNPDGSSNPLQVNGKIYKDFHSLLSMPAQEEIKMESISQVI